MEHLHSGFGGSARETLNQAYRCEDAFDTGFVTF